MDEIMSFSFLPPFFPCVDDEIRVNEKDGMVDGSY